MLSHRNRRNSPVKENISPDHPSFSPNKRTNTIKQLIQILNENKIPIPQQLISKPLNPKTSNCQFKLKEVICDDATELKRLRVQLSDNLFQLKKVEEDFAQYKVITRMQKQKLVKKYLHEIQQLKKKIQEDNTNWQKKYTEKCEEFVQQKKSYEQILKTEYQQKIQSESLNLKNQYVSQIEILRSEVKSLSLTIEQKQVTHNTEKQKLLEEFEQKINSEINSLKSTSTDKQKEIEQKLERKIQIIQLQKKTYSKKCEQIIQKLQKEQQSLKNQIYFLEKEKQELNYQLKAKDRKIMQLQMAILSKEKVYIEGKSQYEQQKQKIIEQFQISIDQLKKEHQKEINQIRKGHLNELDSYQKRINSLQQRKIEIENHYKNQFSILQRNLNQRVSKVEDIEEIERLSTIVAHKEIEIAKYQEQLRRGELARENNQKNYNKIFSAKSYRRKSANTYRDKQSFFKQGNTTDLKLIFKICHKEF